ncbi:hypothetical protein FOZ63_026168 [Perkinsus olseni]|uniref:RING-type domain-containing protein n=1 Tax=Perkinsus olseni TaxID=32597 RepID=A0A7J6Q9G9_PEROL|nr:hypothetical protein FOZ63_026168 [Perkinsus olseni]
MSTCSICMDPVGAVGPHGEVPQLVATECKHVYHEQCLSQWMKRSPTCPECKAEQKSKPVRLKPEVQNLEDHLLPHDPDTVARLQADIADIERENEKLEERIEGVESVTESLTEECEAAEGELERRRASLRRAKREKQCAEERMYTVEQEMQMKLEELRSIQGAVREDMPVREPRPEVKRLRDGIINNRNIDVLLRAVEQEWHQLLESYRRPEEDLEVLTAELNAVEEELQEARANCRSPVVKRKKVGLTAHERVMRRGLERQLSGSREQSVLQRMRTLAGGDARQQQQKEPQPSLQANPGVLQRHATRVMGASQLSEVSQPAAAPLPKLRRTATEETGSSETCPLEDLLGNLLEVEEAQPSAPAKARADQSVSAPSAVHNRRNNLVVDDLVGPGGSSCSYLPQGASDPSPSSTVTGAVVELSSDSDIGEAAPRPAKAPLKRRRVGGRAGSSQQSQRQITDFFNSASSGG